ncbi:hypothetical protein [Jonesia quinghaiensis]|uniref:hypothetical protein n=1 Tax=Jonesia quinghaiensis TaxID=262806 RepID=UPI000412EE0A|nr:hypothetical protein [Jonesia quinghaiensis]
MSKSASWKQRLERRLDTTERTVDPREGGTGRGFGRVVVTIYAILAVAATARALWQLIDHGHQAPLPYALSLLAGVVYIVATVALARSGPVARRVAWVAVLFELVGVIAVGIATVAVPGSFPDQTVWSGFGQGYGYVPLVLPFVGIWWLRRTRAPR